MNQAAVNQLLANCKHKGNYLSIRASDETPSARPTGECDGRRVWRDYGTNETLDDYELYCRLSGIDKSKDKWRVVNEWRETHGKPPLSLSSTSHKSLSKQLP